jgi:hypothetical protein
MPLAFICEGGTCFAARFGLATPPATAVTMAAAARAERAQQEQQGRGAPKDSVGTQSAVVR